MGTEVLDEVFAVIQERRDKPKEGSYISSLLASSKAYEKVDEEARELVEAGRSGGKREIVHEAADLIFHTMVLLAAKGMGPAEVMDELRRRR